MKAGGKGGKHTHTSNVLVHTLGGCAVRLAIANWPKSFAGCASPLDEAQKLPTNAHKHMKRSRTHTLASLVLTPHLRSSERDFCQIPLKLTQLPYQTYKAGLCCHFSS